MARKADTGINVYDSNLGTRPVGAYRRLEARAMRLYEEDGRMVLQCTSEEAGIMQSLLCVARPRGEQFYGCLGVRVIGEAAPAGEVHTPIEEW